MRLVYEGRLPGTNEIVAANRANRYKGAEMKRKTEASLQAQWIPQIRRRYTGPVIIRVSFYERDMRRDDDNVFGGLKFVLDALCKSRVIVDDNPKMCHVLPERFTDRKWPRVVVDIEEGAPGGGRAN